MTFSGLRFPMKNLKLKVSIDASIITYLADQLNYIVAEVML